MDLSDRVAVVTGAGQGLGRAYATALAESGAAVVVNDVNGDSAAETVGLIEEAGGVGVAVVAAVGDTESAELLVSTAVSEFGRLDIMVTNAGILRDRVLWNMSDEDFDAVIRVHLRGTFTCARAAAVHFRERGEGGRLILAGSPAGQRGNFGQTNYAAAKAGIAAMARTWAMELARANVTVNALIPNAVTAMTATVPFLAPFAEMIEKGEEIPSRVRKAISFGTADDCAGLVVFLASDAASNVTGQCIGIGGDRLSLWSHPTEMSSVFRDGGWSADQIAEVFSNSVGEQLESYGIAPPDFGEEGK